MQVVARIVTGFASAAAMAAQAGGDGLTTSADRVPWARFQGRVAFAAAAPALRTELAAGEGAGIKVRGFAVMGDVYLNGNAARDAAAGSSGFRATGGVLAGTRTGLWGSSANASAGGLLSVDRRLFGANAPLARHTGDTNPDTGTVPYLGLGYSNLAGAGGWSFSADLGLVSMAPGNAVRLGRVVGGSQNLDDVVRDMRLAPVVQLGVQYSF